jgi:hypothetical protein
LNGNLVFLPVYVEFKLMKAFLRFFFVHGKTLLAASRVSIWHSQAPQMAQLGEMTAVTETGIQTFFNPAAGCWSRLSCVLQGPGAPGLHL